MCGLLMLDIDHFKSINDRYGHPVGDRVLNSVAKRMINAVRRADLVGRLGGEEFAIFLPRCPRAQVLIVAERIRTSIEALPIGLDNGLEIHVTISIGAVFAQTPGGLNDMLLEADRALYEAKENGRNRTTLSDYNVVAPGA